MSSKWKDPQLDRAQFAADKYYERYQAIGARIAELGEPLRAGKASATDLAEFAELNGELIDLVGRIGKIGTQILNGNPGPHLRKVP